jgi:hypothetical protein
MKMKWSNAVLVLSVSAALLFSGARGLAQPTAASHATNFTSVEYCDAPPNQTQMKTRLSGANAQPGPGELLVIKQFKLETFTTNGSPQAIVEAPECVYDMKNGAANSAGHLRLQSGDGKIRTEGDGFLWRQDDSFLTISNHVHTVIKTGAWKPTKP